MTREGEKRKRSASDRGTKSALHGVDDSPWYRRLLRAKSRPIDALNEVLHYEIHPGSRREFHQRIGEALVEMGVLSEERLYAALETQKRSGKLLGVVLIESGFASSRDIARAVAKQHGLRYVDAKDAESAAEALELTPESMARQYRFVPVSFDGGRLSVLIAGPQSAERLKPVGIMLGCRIEPLVSDIENIEAEISARYAAGGTSE